MVDLYEHIKSSLPYVGKSDDGTIKFCEFEIERPNYNAIRENKKEIKESEFIGALLGFSNDSFRTFCDKTNCQFYEKDVGQYEVYYPLLNAHFNSNEEDNEKEKQHKEDLESFFEIVKDILIALNSAVSRGDLIKIDSRSGKKSFATYPLYEVIAGKATYTYDTFKAFEWAEESGYKIPKELSFVKNDDGGFIWADSNSKVDTSKKATDLTGKERQELGRLRDEKIKMDFTVKAAIEIGQYVENAKNNKELIIKKTIIDYINIKYPKVPQTRIDLIWRSIPDDIKSGSGRPPKA